MTTSVLVLHLTSRTINCKRKEKKKLKLGVITIIDHSLKQVKLSHSLLYSDSFLYLSLSLQWNSGFLCEEAQNSLFLDS